MGRDCSTLYRVCISAIAFSGHKLGLLNDFITAQLSVLFCIVDQEQERRRCNLEGNSFVISRAPHPFMHIFVNSVERLNNPFYSRHSVYNSDKSELLTKDLKVATYSSKCVVVCLHRDARSPSQLQVRLGGIQSSDPESGTALASVTRMFSHPQYDTNTIVADIALLKLSSPVTYTDTILPICLPSSNVNVNQFKVCVSTGFGRTSHNGWYIRVSFVRNRQFRIKQRESTTV